MKRSQLAIQLYTLRDQLKNPSDAGATLKKVRAIGYTTVEVAGIGKVSDDELLKMLQGEGLGSCATHEAAEIILKEPARAADRAKKFGCSHVVYAWPAGVDFSKPDDVRRLIEGLEASGKAMQPLGVTLCYHNHHIEFRRSGARTILEEIFARSDERALQAQLDTYWVQYGGANPAEWCRRMNGRLPLLHMKDYAINDKNEPVHAEIGNGNLDWTKIIAAADAAGCKWFIVEQDTCPGDPFVSIKTSFEFVTSRLCSG